MRIEVPTEKSLAKNPLQLVDTLVRRKTTILRAPVSFKEGDYTTYGRIDPKQGVLLVEKQPSINIISPIKGEPPDMFDIVAH